MEQHQPPLDPVPLNFGLNESGQQTGNITISLMGKTIPWLQDVDSVDVWSTWNVDYRDVVVLNGANEVFGVYNLTEHNLAIPANFEELKSMIIAANADE